MNDRHRPRRRVEIYFVLYLVALVLLMPDRLDQLGVKSEAASLAHARLEFTPDRMRLLCRLTRDSVGGARVTTLDSFNVIRYSGTVTDMRVSARIEEVESGQILTIEPGESATPMFALEHQPQRNAVVFHWRPDLANAITRTFRVTILGSGSPGVHSGANSADIDELPAGLRMTGSTQFVLTTMVENENPATIITLPGGRDTVVVRDTSGGSNTIASLGEFWIDAARDKISTISTREWTNRISVGGADPARDLVGLPRIRVIGESIGDVQRYTDQRTIIVKGRAPRSGTITVEVSAQRRDGQTRTVTFTVSAQPLAVVDVPDVMYPNIEYTVDPKLPLVENSRAVIKDGEREIASASEGVLRIKPQMRDTGRTLNFERIVDGSREGSVQQIQVRSYSVPVIR
ncbi:MAG: hypothetical protein NTX15_04770, partial [Candidatus Kapabacteria bacterium]|nr:hypothetical protein [Candidatus Kapabacteria bacterium]